MNKNAIKRLFIIGNGFDLAHSIKSTYLHFKNFLEKKYDCSNNYRLMSPSVMVGNHGESVSSKKETAQFLYNIIQTTTEQNDLDWNDFEASLAYISLSEIFDWNLFNEYSDDELENYSRKLLNVELL